MIQHYENRSFGRLVFGFLLGLLTLVSTPLTAQTITSFTPTTGNTGTTVTITGTGFNSVTQVNFNGVSAAYFVQSSTSIITQVPTGATTGRISVVTGSGTATSASDFVIGAPVPLISSFNPTSGAVGDNVSITGQNFIAVDSITFNNVKATQYSVNSTTNIVATVPVGATTGPIRIYTPQGSVATTTDYVIGSTSGGFTITSFSPTQGPVGTIVTITGSNLNLVNAASIGAVSAGIQSQSANSLQIIIPSGATTNRINLFSASGSGATATVFTVTGICFTGPQPLSLNFTSNWQTILAGAGTGHQAVFNATAGQIYSFSTCNTALDSYLRIYNNANIEVAFNDDNGPYCASTSASIDWTCPATGQYKLLLTGYPCIALASDVLMSYKTGSTSSTVPTITTFTPQTGNSGTVVTITGTNLNLVTGATISGVGATIQSQTATTLTIVVGVGTTTGPIVLSYAGGQVSSAPTNFVVNTPCINLTTGRGTLTLNSTWQSVTIPTGSNSRYSFTANAGDVVSFSACNSPSVNSAIRVYNASLQEVALFDNNGPYCTSQAASGDYTVTTSGTHYVTISQSSCGTLTGSVVLNYRSVTNTPTIISFAPNPASVGSTITLNGTNLAGVTTVRINGVTQQISAISSNTIIFTVTAGTTTGLIELIFGTGSLTSASQLVINAVSSCFSSITGTFSMSPNTNWQATTAAAGTLPAYQINGIAGQTYNFTTCGTGTTDTKIRIYSAGGVELQSFDDNGAYCTGNRASGDYTPGSTGVFLVVLSDYDCNPLSQATQLQFRRQTSSSVVPTIISFNPVSGPVGTQVTLTGTDLNLVTSVNINGIVGTISGQTSTQLSFIVGTGSTTGPITISFAGGSVSTTSNFVVTTASNACFSTAVNSGPISFTTIWQSRTLTVNGRPRFSFTGVAGNTYNFNTCNSTAANDTKIRIYDNSGVEVAAYDDNGPYCATTKASGDFAPATTATYWIGISDFDCQPLTATTVFEFKVTQPRIPAITSFSPASGPVGTSVIVSGNNLDLVTSASVNGIPAVVTSQNTSAIVMTVQPGSTTGRIRFDYAAGFVESATNFTVTASPQFCIPTATSRGSLNVTAILQNTSSIAGVAPYWTFSATTNFIYNFSTCGAGFDTKIRIYDASFTEVASADDNGPNCAGTDASINFTPTVNDTYYLLITNYDCNVLAGALNNITYQRLSTAAITSFSPTADYIGSIVTIRGSGFTGAQQVSFVNGTIASPQFVVDNDSTIRCIVPSAVPSLGTICVRLANSTTICSAGQFQILALPTFCHTTYSIYGTIRPTTTAQTTTGNSGTSAVFRVDGAAGATYTFSTCNATGTNDTKLRIVNTAGTTIAENDDNGPLCAGTKASLQVTLASSGTFFVHLTDYDCNILSQNTTLTYYASQPAPVITSFTPTSGTVGTRVRISGSSFFGATAVAFNATPASSFTVVDNNTIDATVAAGTTTGRITVTTPFGTGQSNSNFVISVSCNLRLSVTPGANQREISVNVSGGTAPFTYVLNSNTQSGTGASNTILSSFGGNTLVVRDANNCTVSYAYRYYTQQACGSRLTSNTTDSVSFMGLAVTPGTALVLFDGQNTPREANLYNGTNVLAQISQAVGNPTNLTANVSSGSLVVMVKHNRGVAFSSRYECNVGALTRTNFGVVSPASTCGSKLVFSAFPGRQTLTATSLNQVLQPATPGSQVRLVFDAFKLGTNQTLQVFNNATFSGAPMATLSGGFDNPANTTYTFTSTDASGALSVRVSGTGTAAAAGIIGTVTCISQPARLRITATNTTVCSGGSLPINVAATGNITLPVNVTAYLSNATGSFGLETAIGSATINTSPTSLTLAIPSNLILPGTYRVRVRSTTPILVSDTLSLSITQSPAAPTISFAGPVQVCENATTTLSGPVGATGYLWSNGARTQQVTVGPGGYTLQVVIGACTSAVSSQVGVGSLPTPIATFFQRNDTLFAQPTGGTYQWQYNGSNIPNANSSFLKAPFNGNYSVIVTLAPCSDTSAVQVINSLDAVNDYGLQVYPVPAKGQLTIDADEALWPQVNQVDVVNLLGQSVLTQPVRHDGSRAFKLDVSALPAGTYQLRIGKTGLSRRIVIE